jgi:hypothetical protein
MKKILFQARKGWKIVSGALGTIALIFGTYEIYDQISTPEISGQWYITLKIENSTYRPYIGDLIGIKAFFTQTEKSVKGNGEKWEYRGKPIDYNMHDRVDFNGCLDGNCFKASYTLYGKKRQTTGIVDLVVSDDGKKMVGTFSGTAADSRGTIIAMKK